MLVPTLLASLLLAASSEASLYTKNSAVLQATAKTYGRLVAKSNHTSIVEFYAPWCGHCQNLKPAYEKAAKKLQGLAKVVAVNCDEDENKPFCGDMGVKGFPTLKIIRPGKKSGRPTVEEYQGARTAKAIVDAVVEKIPNHVKRVTDKSLDAWLAQSNDTAKAILFSEKGTTSALLRALAIDFLGNINVGQIRNKETQAIDMFGISSYPTLILLPGGSKDPVVYHGEMNKDAMTKFLTQVAPPNPDPAPEAAKPKKEKKTKSTDKKSDDKSAESPESKEKNVLPIIPPITDEATLREKCLSSTSKICALVILPTFEPKKEELPTGMVEALRSMAEVYDKHLRRRASIPTFLVEPSLPIVATLRSELGLKPASEIDIVAVNAKRMWFRKYSGANYNLDTVEQWIDSIRMNEGSKQKLPESLVTQVTIQDDDEPVAEAPKEEPKKDEPKKDEHDEL